MSFKPSITARHKLFLGEGSRKCNKSSHIPRKEKFTTETTENSHPHVQETHVSIRADPQPSKDRQYNEKKATVSSPALGRKKHSLSSPDLIYSLRSCSLLNSGLRYLVIF